MRVVMNDRGVWTSVVVRQNRLQRDGLGVDGRGPCRFEVGSSGLMLVNCAVIPLAIRPIVIRVCLFRLELDLRLE